MDAMLTQLTPATLFLMLGIEIWILVIFPVLVIRKLNYLTKLVESQFEEEPGDSSSQL